LVVDATNQRVARIFSARVVVVALGWEERCESAVACLWVAVVVGAQIVVVTSLGHKYTFTSASIAEICGAKIVVIANNRRMHAHTRIGVTEIFGAL
jgi:hypothetical protein